MILHINGEQREFPNSLTVAALVAQLGMKSDRVAVELNLEIVPRANWETTTLKDGDRLEVVHFVGGGTAGPAEIAHQEPAEAQAAPAGTEWLCPTCGTLVAGRFCPDCGEKKFGASDLSVRHFFSHALGEFFHFDSKIFRTCRLLFTKPGFLTSEYLRGCRRPYLHPFQVFFVANLVYFLLQPYMGWTGLRTTLDVQMHMMSYSALSSRLVAERIAAQRVTLEQFKPSFDHVVDVQARSLVVLMVPLFALVLALLEWRKRRFFGEHLVFSLHFTAFWLIAIFIGVYGGSSVVLRTLAHYGIRFHIVNWDLVLFPFALAALMIYSFVAMRTVYGGSIIATALKALVLTISFHYVLDIYRFILFLSALYVS